MFGWNDHTPKPAPNPTSKPSRASKSVVSAGTFVNSTGKNEPNKSQLKFSPGNDSKLSMLNNQATGKSCVLENDCKRQDNVLYEVSLVVLLAVLTVVLCQGVHEDIHETEEISTTEVGFILLAILLFPAFWGTINTMKLIPENWKLSKLAAYCKYRENKLR